MSQYLLDLIIDPGHGGADPGAVAGGAKEKDFTLQMSLYQLARAKELGLTVGITRSTDVTISLEEHALRVTASKARVCLCNHINAGGGMGAEVYHSLKRKPTLAQGIMQELKRAGAGVHGATGVLTKASAKYKNNDGTPKDYYRMHFTGDTETVIIEYGYIDNPANLKLLLNDWREFAESSLKAACLYLGKTYAPPKPVQPTQPAVKVLINTRPLAATARLSSGVTEVLVKDQWVPLRALVDAMGGSVSWDQATYTAKVTI